MKCHRCLTAGVRNEALGKEFYYCRECKVEIRELSNDGLARLVADLTDTSRFAPGDVVRFKDSANVHMGFESRGEYEVVGSDESLTTLKNDGGRPQTVRTQTLELVTMVEYETLDFGLPSIDYYQTLVNYDSSITYFPFTYDDEDSSS